MIDCQKITKSILEEIDRGSLAVSYNSTDSAANSYVRRLAQTAKDVGIELHVDGYSHQQSAYNVRRSVEKWNESEVDGIIVVSPSPEHYKILEFICHRKRVEGTDFDDNIDRVSCTARACVEIIESVTKIDGKNILIIGYGKAVGKPLSYLLMRKHAGSVTTTHKYTSLNNFIHLMHWADIIVSAVGKPHMHKQYHEQDHNLHSIDNPLEDKILIDAGISVVDGKVTGDFDPELAEKNQLTPVPGGVGPVTTALLLKNVSLSARGEF